jgi:hypothetical protein
MNLGNKEKNINSSKATIPHRKHYLQDERTVGEGRMEK